MTLTATAGPTGPVFHAFCHDVTVERRISRFADVEATVFRGIADAPSSRAAAARVVEALGVTTDWPVAELWLADEERHVVHCAARHAGPGRRLGRFALDQLPTRITPRSAVTGTTPSSYPTGNSPW